MRFNNKYLLGLGLSLALSAGHAQDDVSHAAVRLNVHDAEEAVPATRVTDIGGFAGDRIRKNKDHYLKTFPIGHYVGLMEARDFTGWDWRQGEQPGKWLESAILTAARTHDHGLEQEARDMYRRILHSQAADGYIGITSQSVRTPQKPLGGMDAYELYFLQHALLTAYEVWNDPKALEAAKRLGDYFVRYIGPGKAEFWPSALHDPQNRNKVLKGSMHSAIAGHSIHYSWEGTLLIDPMMRLYELSGDKRYYAWCRWVVRNIDKWSGWNSYSNLDKVAAGTMPVNKIQPYVHAHTFQMNFLGLLRMYQVSGDSSYLRKVEGAWRDIAGRQRYITGGVSVGEHYERDDVKPLTGDMMETCATMSWMQLSEYLLELTGDPAYADAIERIQWNQVFAEQTIDGDANRYFTPPNGYTPKGYFREPDCCMGSGHRLLSMLPGFIYAAGNSGSVYINQFVPSTTAIGKVRLTQETGFPADGRVRILVSPGSSGTFSIRLRIPAWCDSPTVTVNGAAEAAPRAGTYYTIRRRWRDGDVVVLSMPMKPGWVRHAHYEKTSDRRPYRTQPDADAPYALVRGPVVYAVDDIWYTGDTAVFGKGWMDSMRYVLTAPPALQELQPSGKDILGPGYLVTLARADGNGGKIALPVYPFANIGRWYRDPAHKPDSNAAAWTYAVWLKGVPDLPSRVSGRLTLPYVFGDNMVLQRHAPVPVWGQAGPGDSVAVRFEEGQPAGGQSGAVVRTARTVADRAGHWRVTLDPMPASATPGMLTVQSGDAIVGLRNVLVGEVWLCSGQSNMEYSMRKNSKFEHAAHGSGPPDELGRADNPAIRIFLVRNNYSKPDPHIRRAWDTAAGAPLRDFSAAGYFMAKTLQSQLGVPVGVISNAIPGSAIEPWLPDSGKFYKTLVEPLAPYAIRGFCWYQGETNCMENDTAGYPLKMESLIRGWRRLWGDTALSFYFVQIAPYFYSRSDGGHQTHSPELEPVFWEAQRKALSLPHTGMVVTTDLVDSPADLHPAYKWEVGRRLALLALAGDYHRPVLASGPVFQHMTIRKNIVELVFNETGSGLISHDGQPLNWFQVAARNGKFVAAKAEIVGPDTIRVSARGIRRPRAVRFGWNEGAQPNLFNKEGLPAMPFRTDAPADIQR
ncbi:MAG TPA: beta-L-arabinofuranosidase domain-containing protein [Puia sp.]|nr:beta-L-arabinofuranosidase domain-containing protein [Puia sp.]